jgi:hypothetical protein
MANALEKNPDKNSPRKSAKLSETPIHLPLLS